jgi:hypothetical protein
MKRLRYVLDRIAARLEPHCPDDWNDCHRPCARCRRVWDREQRIACYEAARTLPIARISQ